MNENARNANEVANDAETHAQEAKDDAAEALAIAQQTSYSWWSLSEAKTVGSNTFNAGSYGTFIKSTNFQTNPANQPNIFIDANGLHLRRALTDLSSFTGTALTFNNPITGTAQLVIGSNGTLQSGNYSRGSNATFSAFGTKIDLTEGEIYSPYFRLSQGAQGKDPGAYISGQIEALGGNIGGTEDGNYWEIGDFTNYNNISIGSLIGHGNSMIQLGQSSVWRLSNNRIHSGWYLNTDKQLHFPNFNGTNKYYDYGIHVPESTTQSFLYLRTADTTNNLSSLLTHLNDDVGASQTPWNYLFYVDGSGNVHAPAYYVGDDPLTGGVGSIAEKIINSDNTYGKGSLTQPIYLDNNGRPATTTYALNAAGAKGVITDFTNNTTSTDLPTTAAVVNYVTSRGYITSYTDNKVQTSTANTTKLYITGTSSSTTATDTLNFDSNVYLTTTAGTLHATTFEGDLSGTASRATADSDGNTIKTTYLKLTGGNVTGAVTFGSSVSIDELTTGNLVVNGAASFTNNLQANTINGVSVGNDPKFTDSEVSTFTLAPGSTSGVSLTSGGKFTLTAGSKTVSFTMPTIPVTSVNGQTGAISLTAADVSATLVQIVRW